MCGPRNDLGLGFSFLLTLGLVVILPRRCADYRRINPASLDIDLKFSDSSSCCLLSWKLSRGPSLC